MQTPQSLLISSITVGIHRDNRVAAHMKVPCMLPPPQPRSQTLIPIPSTTLRLVPITVRKAPAQPKYQPSRLLLPSRPIDKVAPMARNTLLDTPGESALGVLLLIDLALPAFIGPGGGTEADQWSEREGHTTECSVSPVATSTRLRCQRALVMAKQRQGTQW